MKKIAIVILLTLLLVLMLSSTIRGRPAASPPAPISSLDDLPLQLGEPQPKGHPKMESTLYELALLDSKRDRNEVDRYASRRGLPLKGRRTRVVLDSTPGATEALVSVAKGMGLAVEAIYQNHVQAFAPLSRLLDLAELPLVRYVRLPYRALPLSVTSEGVAVIGADAWHSAGYNGNGVKIAVFDSGFQNYPSLIASGELPTDVVSRSFRSDGDIAAGEMHGTACAEIIYDVAPGAQLYLINFETDVEFGNAVDYAIAQGVQVASCSLGWLGAGPFDGTGPICDIVNHARDNGIFWAQSAGNSANKHWEGLWFDPDSDNVHNFTPDDEGQSITVSSNITIHANLVWDDPWGASSNDYDLYLYDSYDQVVASSTDRQEGDGFPSELITYNVGPGGDGTYYLVIHRFSASTPAYFDLYSFRQAFEHQVPSSSLLIPADGVGAVASGAVYWATDGLETFSSRGPTNDGRLKPEFTAPDGVSSATYSSGFYGTSAAAPHLAGATALVWEAYPSYSVTDTVTFLAGRAVDLGSDGVDNEYGYGRLSLGSVPATATPTPTGTATPTPSQAQGPLYPVPTDRFGVALEPEFGLITDYDVASLDIAWYSDWAANLNPLRPGGIEYAQLIWVGEGTFYPPLGELGPMIDANLGSLWMVGNEPECIWQGNNTPEQYAVAYRDLYTFIKARDPTAQVAMGGVVQPTPLRLEWLDGVLNHYQTTYGEPMPVDVWNIHNQILQEMKGGWGCEIPVGLTATEGRLYGIEDNDNIEIFRQHIVDFRTWMRDRGEQEKPLIISEIGVLFPEEYGYPPERVNAFMDASFDYLLMARDPELGYPEDENRLVQRWMWYSLNDQPWDPDTGEGFNGALFDYRYPEYPGVITPMGIHFREYTGGLLTNPLVTVTLQQGSDGYMGSEDTYIYQYTPDDNYCSQDVLNVGREQQYAGLVRFDLSSIPTDARVVEATLQLYASGWDGSDMTIDAYRIRRDVNICQATWNQAGDGNPWDLPGCNDPDTDRGATPESSVTTSGISRWYSLNLTIVVQDWMNGRLANNGVLLRGAESGSSSLFRFASAEVGTSTLRPKLVITYRSGSGSEEAQTGDVGPPVPEEPEWTAELTF